MAKTNTLIILAAALLAAASCSIKEDRQPCPCWLRMDFGRCPPQSVTVSAWNGSELFSERIAVQDYSAEGSYEKTVAKGYVNTSVTSGERKMVRSGSVLKIPVGCDADSLWAHAGRVDCSEESATDTVILHKQFARVFVSVKMHQDKGYPYTLTACSDVAGMDLRDLSPVEGEFRHDLKIGEEGICMFCIPRQKEDGGELRIVIHEQGRAVEAIPLAAWIEGMGYSWIKKDLDDIYIGVDYARAEVSIAVQGWAEGHSFKVEI
jgi:hypothetical protein